MSEEPQGRDFKGLIAGVVLLVAVVAVVLFELPWLLAAIDGPKPITAADLAAVTKPSQLPLAWVTYSGPIHDTNLEWAFTSQGGAGPTTSHWSKLLVLDVNGRRLLAEAPRDFQGNSITGKLIVWDDDKLAKAKKAVGEQGLMPFQMDANYGYDRWSFYLFVIVMAALGIVSVFLITAGLLENYGKRARRSSRKKESRAFRFDEDDDQPPRRRVVRRVREDDTPAPKRRRSRRSDEADD